MIRQTGPVYINFLPTQQTKQITITIMTTQLDTQFGQPSFDALRRYLDFEAKLTPVGINRLVKSGAMAPTRAAELKSSYCKKQARKHALKHQAKKRVEEIAALQKTEVALVSVTKCARQVVHEAKDKMNVATLLHAQVSAELSTQEERLVAVRRRIAKLQGKTAPSTNVPSPAAPSKAPKTKKASRKRTAYNMFVKHETAAICEALGDAAKMRGATMKEAGKRWKALSSDERTPYVTAAYQHNAKMAATQQETT